MPVVIINIIFVEKLLRFWKTEEKVVSSGTNSTKILRIINLDILENLVEKVFIQRSPINDETLGSIIETISSPTKR